jgi:ankyrin repeat protein
VNAAQSQKMTALMLAAKCGSVALTKLLCASEGIDLDLRDTQEWSALCFAADQGRGDVAREGGIYSFRG